MRHFILTMLLVTALASRALAQTGSDGKVAVTATLDACAMAIADAPREKAGGDKTSPMSVACIVTDRGRSWACITSYPNEAAKSQSWTLASRDACDVTGAPVGCSLRNSTGSLYIVVAIADRKGIMNLRMDLDTVHATAIAARVCAGPLVVGIP